MRNQHLCLNACVTAVKADCVKTCLGKYKKACSDLQHNKSVSVEDERECLSFLRKISYTMWKRDIMLERQCDNNLKKNGKKFGEKPCEVGKL